MGYDKTTGVIIGSPSIYDVQRALGVSECDLKSLATHSKLNVLSKYKPTDYAYNFVLPSDTNAWNNFWRGRAKYDSSGSLYVGCGMIVPYFSIPASKTSLANNNHTLDRDLGVAGGSIDSYWIGDMTNIINSSMISTDYSNGATMPKWTKIPPSAGQLVEFLYYTSRSPVYNKTASLPFTLSVAMPQSQGNATLDPSAQITYNYNDVKVTTGSDSAYWLGVKSLFGCDSGDGGADLEVGVKRRFGVIVCNTNSSRKYVLISNSNTVQMDDDPTHGVTGLDYIKNVGGNILTGQAFSRGYFAQGDKVNVIPVIIAKSNADNKYYFFTLGLDSISPIYTFQLRENIPTQAIHVRRITFKLSYKFVQSRVFDFYIANNTDVKIVAQSVTRNYTSTNNHLYFVSNVLQITPADSIGNAVDVKTATLGTHSSDTNTYRYSPLDTGSHISQNTGETFYAETMLSAFWGINNFRSRIRFNGDGTSAKVGLTIPIYHRQKDNADTSVSKMVTEYFNFEFTINPSRQSDGYLEVTVNAQYDFN